LGVFKYSEEDGTAAARMPQTVPEEEKERRWQEIMDLQSSISRKKNEALIGTIQRVMIDEVDYDSERVSGRTQAHAPEVDGTVHVEGWAAFDEAKELSGGDMIDVKIVEAHDYDLIGEKLHG
jgi:ribosomal protein S12 methylthiotransferase